MLPLYYYPISWSQQSHVSQFGSALNKAFDGIDMSSGYFILSPIVYEFSEPQKFRLKS
ncbi:MAG TPA: hypothetical protein VM802_06870 [Chitinophaga sp.]|uniref:hypothetical protein n=1 Tax=Chitinophaga sp. TaxID=1869181 RepID=UPI002B8FAA00|nr:hypothetical protein [Chitinophaga sp.]HVI44572.1 hypothetical protein [Chitinophaga sp.]